MVVVYPKLNVQNSAELWDKITAPEWSCPPTTPIECPGYDEYLTLNLDPTEWGLIATMGLVTLMIFIMVVRRVVICFTQWEERRWASRIVKAGPEERVEILGSWCGSLGVSVEGTDLDLGEKRPLPYTLSGISRTEVRKDVEERLWLGFEEGEKMEKGALI